MAGPAGFLMLAALTSVLLGLVAMWIALVFALAFAAVLALAWAI